MDRDTAVARIKRGLDFRTGTTQDAAIVLQLQESQRLLEKGKELPRWLIEEDDTLSVTSGTAEIALPAGFLKEVDGETFQYYDDSADEWVLLEKMTLNEAKTRFAQSDAGRPVAYVLRKTTVAFYPERDDDYALTWSYYKAADELTTGGTENVWLEFNPEVLIGHAGMVFARDLGNDRAEKRFTQMFVEARAGQIAEDVEREWENDAPTMGGRL